MKKDKSQNNLLSWNRLPGVGKNKQKKQTKSHTPDPQVCKLQTNKQTNKQTLTLLFQKLASYSYRQMMLKTKSESKQNC
jgi:hypothetical protein